MAAAAAATKRDDIGGSNAGDSGTFLLLMLFEPTPGAGERSAEERQGAVFDAAGGMEEEFLLALSMILL